MESTKTKWRINGVEMSHPQVIAWREKQKALRESKAENVKVPVPTDEEVVDKAIEAGKTVEPEPEVEGSEEQKVRDEKDGEEGYSVKSSTERDYNTLKEKMKEAGGYFKLYNPDQKRYSLLKKQLGK